MCALHASESMLRSLYLLLQCKLSVHMSIKQIGRYYIVVDESVAMVVGSDSRLAILYNADKYAASYSDA